MFIHYEQKCVAKSNEKKLNPSIRLKKYLIRENSKTGQKCLERVISLRKNNTR